MIPSSIKERAWHYLKKYVKYFFFFWVSGLIAMKLGDMTGTDVRSSIRISFFLAPLLIMAYNWIRDYGMSSVYKQIETMSHMYDHQRDD